MANYKKTDKSRDRRGFGKREFYKPRFGGDRKEGGRSEMFQAVCATCGKDCEVPFRPSGSKPVYCRECYTKDPGARDQNRFQDKLSYRPNFEKKEYTKPQNSQQLEAIERKLDKIIKILTAPVVAIELVKEVEELKEVKKGKAAKPKKSTDTPPEIDAAELAIPIE